MINYEDFKAWCSESVRKYLEKIGSNTTVFDYVISPKNETSRYPKGYAFLKDDQSLYIHETKESVNVPSGTMILILEEFGTIVKGEFILLGYNDTEACTSDIWHHELIAF